MAHLAINGGSKAAEGLCIPRWPIIGDEERRLLNEVLESGRWGRLDGSRTDEFERAFADFQGVKHGIAVTNGTVALELALLAAGVRPLDEVIVPAVSFIASATAVVRVGAIPIFADCDPTTACISPAAVKDALTPRTSAVLCVHYGGYPCDLDALTDITRQHGLALIEDCAHAQGTQWRGQGVGAFGAIGGMSFQASKSLCLGEGGIVMTNNDDIAERARLIHHIGRKIGRPGYEHYIIGSNYRLTEFQAAVGLAQLARLPNQIAQRQMAREYLAAEFARIGGLSVLPDDPRITRRGFYFLVLRYDAKQFGGLPRDRFLAALRAEGVPASAGYGMPLYRQPAFQRNNIEPFYPRGTHLPNYENLFLPSAERFCAHEQITIPHAMLLASRSDLEMVICAVEKIKEHVDEIL